MFNDRMSLSRGSCSSVYYIIGNIILCSHQFIALTVIFYRSTWPMISNDWSISNYRSISVRDMWKGASLCREVGCHWKWVVFCVQSRRSLNVSDFEIKQFQLYRGFDQNLRYITGEAITIGIPNTEVWNMCSLCF